MEFLGIGPGEVVLIIILGLIVWGPGKLVEVGRTLGKTIRAVKKATSDLTVQVNRELEEEKKKFREESQKGS